MTASAAEIEVTVALALPDRATVIAVRLPAGATVSEALERSGLSERHPDANVALARVGIFGRLVNRDSILRDGDRVEVYRALLADPKKARLNRAGRRAVPISK